MLRHATYKRNEKDFATKVVEDDSSGIVTLYVDDKPVPTVEVDPVTRGVEIPFVAKGKSSAALAAAPSAADIALGDSTLFYDIADPTKRYAMNAARSAFVLVADGRVEPYILYQSAIPVILLPSGAVNSSGQFTLTSALPYVPAGTVKVYVFSGVGLASGLYDATFSSTTVCQVTGNPATTAGSYASGTAEVSLADLSVPGGLMGKSGGLRISATSAAINNSNTKTLRGKLGGSVYNGTFSTCTTQGGCSLLGAIRNRGSFSLQVGSALFYGAAGQTYTAINTALDSVFSFTGQLGGAADYLILDGYTVEILPGA